MKTKFFILACAVLSLSACESTRNDLTDLLNTSANAAGKKAGR